MRKKLYFILLLAGLFWLTPGLLADWSTAKRLTWTSGISSNPVIAVDSADTIHVVWSDNTPGNSEIYYKNSADGGATWSATKRLSWTSWSSRNPRITIDSADTIHIVWSDPTPGYYVIYYKRSTDGGATWGETRWLSWPVDSGLAPAIAADSSDNIYVVWTDNLEIYRTRSTDGGGAWSAAKRITWTSGDSYDPVIATDSTGAVHVVWYDYTPGDSEIYYKRSTDGGGAWSAAKRITWTSGYSGFPEMAIDGNGTIHVVWEDETPGNMEIYYKGSADGGETWSAAKGITWTSGESSNPAIAIGSGNAVHVVWDEETADNKEIFYRQSLNGGATWGASSRITWTSGISSNPVIAVDSADTIHVVWSDNTPGNGEIYYKKST
jgi:hypothetical protein